MSGPEAAPEHVQGFLSGFSASIAASQVLASLVATAPARARVVRARAGVAGSSGSTVIDLVRNGVSMYKTVANRPTLVAAATGDFKVGLPPEAQAIVAGDLVQLVVVTTAGHQQVTATAALEVP